MKEKEKAQKIVPEFDKLVSLQQMNSDLYFKQTSA